MIQRVLPYEGLLHEVVEHNGVLYIGGIVPEDTTLADLGPGVKLEITAIAARQ
jgi:hypothetical protein